MLRSFCQSQAIDIPHMLGEDTPRMDGGTIGEQRQPPPALYGDQLWPLMLFKTIRTQMRPRLTARGFKP